MKLNFIVHLKDKGYSAQCETHPGIITQGDMLDDLIDNIHDAICTYFDGGEIKKGISFTLEFVV